MATELVKRTELQDYFGGDKQLGANADLVRLGVHAAIEKYCRREIGADAEDRSEAIRILSYNQRQIILAKPPINSITKIETGDDSLSLVDATSYEIASAEAGIVRMIASYFLFDTKYTITYKGGFAEIPEDLKLAALSIMAREIETTSKGRFGMRGRAFHTGSVELFIEGLTKTERLILDGYRLMRF